jgi:hypothetical protein
MPADKPKFEARKNLTDDEIAAMIRASKVKAVRRITDPRTGDNWYWPAEMATHREGADQLAVPYDKRSGEGDILTL